MAGKRDELAQHIQRLCDQHGVDIVERKSRGAWARKRGRTISIRPVKTERTYIIALHEIGHIVGRNRSARRLEQEAAAWDFVLEQSIVPLSDASYAFILRCLDSYLRQAAHSRRSIVIPEKGHRFWKTYEAIVHRIADGNTSSKWRAQLNAVDSTHNQRYVARAGTPRCLRAVSLWNKTNVLRTRRPRAKAGKSSIIHWREDCRLAVLGPQPVPPLNIGD